MKEEEEYDDLDEGEKRTVLEISDLTFWKYFSW
jgi:hypothetical protein